MPTNTIFGPQGYNAVTALPSGASVNRYGSGVDTWVKDCAAGDKSGTILDAQFFNTIIGNLRNLVQGAIANGAAITISDGDMTAVLQAVQFFSSPTPVTVGPGLQIVGQYITIDVSTLKVMVA